MAKKGRARQAGAGIPGAVGGINMRPGTNNPNVSGVAPRPSAPAIPVPPPAPAIPAPPAPVAPFFTAEDLAALNDFITNWQTSLSGIDQGLASLQTDTTFQKTQLDTDARKESTRAEDVMAARGIFQSSLKDAAIYDIEAQRALQSKFLDDKLTQATIDAGTNKKILNDSKTNFDRAMEQKKWENAKGVNDQQSAAWADAKVSAENAFKSWQSKYGAKPTAPKPAGISTPKVVASGPQPSSTGIKVGKAKKKPVALGLPQ